MGISEIDDCGRVLTLRAEATRIVSLVPSLTELLVVMGCSTSIVGITRYCVEPAEVVQGIPKFGGTKNPDLGRIRDVAPDLVVVNAEENRRVDFEALCAAGMNVFVSSPRRVAEIPSLMRRLGRLTGAIAAAADLAAELEAALDRAMRPAAPQRRVFCPIWKNPWMSFNDETYAADLLRLAGGLNVCATHADRYPQVDLPAIARSQPEVILLPDEPYVFGPRDLPALEPLAMTPALAEKRVHFVDGKALSWYGPRTAPALEYFKSLLD
jgi:ABC-type hemin transport system substrate-binding protein